MYSVEVHTPISMNDNFAIMCFLLVESLAKNAGFPGDWKVVFSVSRDSTLGPDSPQFAWARHYPVEFVMADETLWRDMHYAGTGTQCIINDHRADVILYIDADIVVNGSLREITERISRSDAVFGWPAWFSGDAPFDDIFRAAGIRSDHRFELTLTDEGAAHWEPGWPFYLNFGFIGVPLALAKKMRTTFPADQMFVHQNFGNYFSGQVALALNIARNGYAVEPIDERYNASSDHPLLLQHCVKVLGREMFPSDAAKNDPRVLHYCFPTPTLRKGRDMADWESLEKFLQVDGLEGFERRLQQTIRELDLRIYEDAHRFHEYRSRLGIGGGMTGEAHRQDRETAEQLRESLENTRSDLGHAETAIKRLKAELLHERESSAATLAAMKDALSWRITQPLRSIYDLVRRPFKR